MTNLGALPDERLPLLRGAAQGQGHGNLSGARLRRARLSRAQSLKPIGDDRVRSGIASTRAMHDREAEFRIFDPRALAAARLDRRTAGD